MRLVGAGADPNIKLENGTALVAAVHGGDVESVRFLLEAGADPFVRDVRQQSMMTIAAKTRRFDIAGVIRKYLPIVRGPSGTKRYRLSGDLLRALERKDLATFKTLLEMGANADERDHFGQTLLFRICAGNNRLLLSLPHRDIVQLLIHHGADVNARAKKGRTPLMGAAGAGSDDLVSLLIDKGAVVDAKTDEGRTALIFASIGGHVDVAEVLLKAGADPNVRTNRRINDIYPLYEAVRSGNHRMVRRLIEAGARIDSDGPDKGDLFAMAGRYGLIVKLLVATGVDLNSPDGLGRYPLSQILLYGTPTAARILMEAGASPDIKTRRQAHPLVIAAQRGQVVIIDLLYRKSKRLPTDDRLQKEALWTAVEYGHKRFVEALMGKGVTGTLKEAEQVISRSRQLKKKPHKQAELRALFQKK
jgi:ankyrin repeat protein